MKLNTKSWHYKLWASSFPSDSHIPLTTDLCRYCHYVFWQVVLRVYWVVMALFMLCLVGYGAIYQGFFLHTKSAFITLGLIVGVCGSLFLYLYWLRGRRSSREPRTLIGKFAKASKDRVCPLVEFTDTEDDKKKS